MAFFYSDICNYPCIDFSILHWQRDLVSANIGAYSRIYLLQSSLIRDASECPERENEDKWRKREKARETDRGRDGIKDTAKTRKGDGRAYEKESERGRMTMTSNEAPGSWNGAEKGGRDAARRDADAPRIFG